jgi:hypothetical protein
MGRAAYPLRSLSAVRSVERDRAEAALARAVQAASQARDRLAAALEALLAHRRGTSRWRDGERSGQAPRHADGLACGAAYLERRLLEERGLAAQAEACRQSVRQADAELRHARAALARAQARVAAVDRHHARWNLQQRQQAERRQDG